MRISRDARQEESRIKWIKNKCRGTIVAPTGVGFEKNPARGKNVLKFSFSDKFISITGYEAVPIEESKELLQTKIGEIPEKENPEVITETKESVAPYSVETEPANTE